MSAPPLSQANGATMTPEQIQEKWELGIWHTLYNWEDLKTAIQNGEGESDGEDVRDWLAGRISEMFDEDPGTDALDIEVVLLETIEDNFLVRLETDSEVKIAQNIMKIRDEISKGNFSTFDALHAEWLKNKDKPLQKGKIRVVETNQDWEGDSVDEESEDDEDDDVSMTDAPPLVPVKVKPVPEVDEDGFTKVIGKKGR
ncbi:uncharacterized protein BDZ99DRAFT_468495 [Mytilinidion resinicola]|uniref:Pre-rRNA-processing protein-like protein TSR2 n=1 Tax=Mytilinidion resinicola TaxID=574789 RepID=A0A6A6Y5U7_9PEZI|nr:uncharacterized protein BDZ99DRAFT_468495 [Mytilinidion resinicola]KAF2803157.1 hypothetical protein BDZ99DRAFT_468495 [Mytilinidion resinicola]